MFDSSVNNSFKYNINAVSGTLRKSHPKSKFCVRDINTSVYVFKEPSRLYQSETGKIVVLQVMLVSENKCLIEYVFKRDFEELTEGI
mgnify:FL=1